MLTVTESSENRVGTRIPTCPCEWSVSIHVASLNVGPRIQKHPDGVLSAERRSAVQGRFGLRSAIAHEATRFNRRPGNTVGIRTIAKQHFENEVMSKPISRA